MATPTKATLDGVIPPQARYGYIPGLDGVRALAVMMVIIAHIGFEHIIPGGFGVTVFFFISGFLITRLLLAELGASGGIDLPKFYIRRFLRLLPALYVMLLTTGAVLILMGDVPKLWETIAAFTWTMNYHYAVLAFTNELRVAPWEHLWSLAVEEHFYLIYPLVLVGFRRNLPLALKVSLAICVASLIWRLTTIHVLDFPGKYNYAATETRMESIVWGCMLSLGLHLYPTSAVWRRLVGPVPVLAALCVLLVCFLYREEAFRETFRYTLQGAGLFVCVLNLFFWPVLRPVVGLLDREPFGWTGRVSYGLYLWHMPALMFSHSYLGFQVGTPAYMAFGVAFSFALAALSYYAVERPVMGLRRRFGSHASAGKQRVNFDASPEVTPSPALER